MSSIDKIFVFVSIGIVLAAVGLVAGLNSTQNDFGNTSYQISEDNEQDNMLKEDLAPKPKPLVSITVSGTGDVAQPARGGGACPGSDAKVAVSIVGGTSGNEIKGIAKCTSGSTNTSATAEDIGGAAQLAKKVGHVSAGGVTQCNHEYDGVAGGTDSAWTIVCDFW